MSNFEVLEKKIETKKYLTPDVLSDYVTEYPGLNDDYKEVIEASRQMNMLIQELSENVEGIDLDDWNRKQVLTHNNLIEKVTQFIDDLGKFDDQEAGLLRVMYNRDRDKRLYFTKLSLAFLNK